MDKEFLPSDPSNHHALGNEGRLRDAVLMIARKASLAAHNEGNDFVYELAHTAITHLVGPGAVHNVEHWKTQEKLEWAVDQITNAVK